MKRFRLPTIIMAGTTLLLLMTVIGGLFNISNLRSQIENFKSEVTGVNNNYTELQTELENLNDEYAILEAKLIENNNKYNELLLNYNALLESHSDLTITNEENESTIIALHEELNTLTAQNKYLEDEVNNLTVTMQTLSTQIQDKPNENTDIEESTIISTTTSQIVYWVEKGEVWHTSRDCSSLSRSTNIQSGTIEESGKVRKCSRC